MPSFRDAMSGALLFTLMLSIQAAAADINTIIQQCEDCHGKNGVSDADDVPTITCWPTRKRRDPVARASSAMATPRGPKPTCAPPPKS
jgi:hypothetical protein